MKQSISKKQTPLKRMSLKESHRRRMLLAEEHERQMIVAESTALMLLEALNKEDLKNATRVLKKLNAISKFAPASLKAAIKDAADEVNEFTGGGLGALLKKAGGWLAKKLGAGSLGSNPILKALTLLNCIENGFSDISEVIENNAPDYDGNSDKSLMDQVDDTAAKNLRKIIAKSFEPEGIYAKIKGIFSSSGGIPYVKDLNAMVEETMMLPAKQLSALSKAASSGESSNSAAEATKDMAAAAQSKGGESSQVKKSPEQPVKTIEDLATAVAAGQTEKKGEEASPAVEKAKENPKAVVKQFVDYIQKQSNQSADVVQKVLNALVKNGKMKSSFSVVEGKNQLTMNDVIEAQVALLECGGSSTKWVEILFEKSNRKAKKAQKMAAKKSQTQQQQTQQQPAKEEPKQEEPKQSEQTPEQSKEEPKQPEQTDSKHAATIKAIQDDLKDVDVKSIEAVLDVIPDYLKVENAKHFLSRSSRVI
jgi:hypothetical protein